jgi:hypothetical protein
MTKSWKTTSAGILAIIGGVTRLIFAIRSGDFSEEAIMTSATAILAGVGLLFAKDNDVTGGTIQQ